MLGLRGKSDGITIVEVMISLSILGLVLGLSYSTASRSLSGARDSQERAEAYQYAEAIVEGIRYYTLQMDPGPSGAGFPPSRNRLFPPNVGIVRDFCLDPSASAVSAGASQTSGTPALRPAGPGNPDCSGGIYTSRVDVVRQADTVPGEVQNYLYTVTINWTSLNSDSPSQVLFRYKVSEVID